MAASRTARVRGAAARAALAVLLAAGALVPAATSGSPARTATTAPVLGATARVVAAPDRPDTLAAARRAGATPLGRWVEERLGTRRDDDWYRVQVPARTWATVVLGDLPGNYRLRLYDERGTRLGTSDRGGRVYEEITRTLAAGTYFVRVDSTGAYDARRPYALRVRTLPRGVPVLSLRRTPAQVVLVGEVVNTTSDWRVVTELRLAMLDARGRVLRTTLEALQPSQALAPGERVGFSIGLPPDALPRGTVRFRISTRSGVIAAQRPHLLPVRVTRREEPRNPTADRTYWFTVTNPSARAFVAVVVAREYDARGTLNRIGDNPVNLRPHATGRFWVAPWPRAPVNRAVLTATPGY